MQMHPVPTIPFCSSEIHFNIALISVRRYSKRSVPFRFSEWNVVHIIDMFHMCYISCHIQDLIVLIRKNYLNIDVDTLEILILWRRFLSSSSKASKSASMLTIMLSPASQFLGPPALLLETDWLQKTLQGSLMSLNYQLMEIPKWKNPLISCATQV